jgi:hypothetical protein
MYKGDIRTVKWKGVIMRLAAIAIAVTLIAVVPASGQAPASAQHPYGLDPYKPSDAALLRDYGVTLVAQTPLSELRKLDPYKPSHAALLRGLGGAFPVWGLAWYAGYPAPISAPLTPFPTSGSTSLLPATVTVLLVPQLSAGVDGARAAPVEVAPQPASSVSTLRRPENNDGVWISFEQQKWISAGRTVPFEESEFVRVGQYGEFPVFRRTRVSEEVIYVPTREGLLAPYRLKP